MMIIEMMRAQSTTKTQPVDDIANSLSKASTALNNIENKLETRTLLTESTPAKEIKDLASEMTKATVTAYSVLNSAKVSHLNEVRELLKTSKEFNLITISIA